VITIAKGLSSRKKAERTTVKTSDSCLGHGLKILDRGLEAISGAAHTARHPLYDLYRLAALILNDVSDVDEALVAAVGVHALKG
jgi:hypothetical protein